MADTQRHNHKKGTEMGNHLVPTPNDWEMLKDQAKVIAQSGLAPSSLRSPEAIAVVALKGYELGIPAMMAMNHIHVIQGKPTISAELMRAMILRDNHRFRVVESTPEKAIVEGQRFNSITGEYDNPVQASFTMQDAERAKITGKDNWTKYPKNMLVARATAILAREHFADVLMGASYTPDEIDPDVAYDPTAGTVVLSVERDEPKEKATEVSPTKPNTKQIAAFHLLMRDNGVDEEQYREALSNHYNTRSVNGLTIGQMSRLLARLNEEGGIDAFLAVGGTNEEES